jgi:hypothetical protein
LAIEASLGYPNAAWGLRYFATALSVEKLAHLVGVTEGDTWNEASKEMFAGRITRDQAEARCSPALSFTARDALYELSDSAWDSRMAEVAERVVLSKLNKAKERNKNVVHDPRYRCRRPGGQAVSYDACEVAWRSYITKKSSEK